MTIETRIHGMFQHDKTPVKSIDINCVMISKFHNFSKSFFVKGGFENKSCETFPTNFNMCENLIFHQRKEVVWICIKFYWLVVFFSFFFFFVCLVLWIIRCYLKKNLHQL
jgi:hypothetical protein